ncbi:Ulp1 protease family, carboxy-terminal catalytic domain protein [Ceratobasidium sp. AG-Ba]|nr:Ulp1 protease family, carboxy-terminal catalytic domain protein [Ceratobasidium sp. AG-Ba]
MLLQHKSRPQKGGCGRPRHVHAPIPTSPVAIPIPTTGSSAISLEPVTFAQQPISPSVMSGESISPSTLARHQLVQEEAVLLLEVSSDVNDESQSLDKLRLRKTNFGPEWKQVAVIETLQLPKWFEKERNDYVVKQYHETSSVTFDWIDLPGDDSKDVRACHFNLQRQEQVSLWVWDRLIEDKSVVWRAQYTCSRTCQRIPSEDIHDTSKVLGEEVFDLDITQASPILLHTKPKATKGQRKKSDSGVQACPVMLRLEIYAHDLKNVHIWIKHSHKDAPETVLTWSQRIHLQAVNLSRNEGATTAQIMKCQALLPILKITSGPNTVPSYRKPTVQNIENIMPASRRRQHYAKNAFASLDIFATLNKDRVFLYQAYHQDSGVKLMCAITDEFSLGSALLYAGTNGLFMDATWRGMNQNFAPTTFLLAVDDNGHATPVAALLSQDVQADSLEKFLKAWKKRLHAHAANLVNGAIMNDRDHHQQDRILESAKQVLAGTWKPQFMMIDKDRAELKASSKVFPDTPVRVCQFHAIQAIQRWLHASHAYILEVEASKQPKVRKSRSKQTFTVPPEAHSNILELFRYTQRCRNHEEFTVYQDAFESGLKQLCHIHSISRQFPTIQHYFRENFWSSEWCESVTDIGLPAGHTRDKILNTNNHAESFIKTFKHTVLGMRRNERIDTLAIIIADILLPFYQIWQNDSVRHTQQHLEITHRGYQIWTSGFVKTLANQQEYSVDDIIGDKGRRFKVTYGASVNPSCTCRSFGQTGKICPHIWASRLYHLNGDVHAWAESANKRMSEKAFVVKDLYRHDNPLPDEVVTISEQFPQEVKQWKHQDDQLATSGFNNILHLLKPSSNQETSFNLGGRPQAQVPIRPVRKSTYRDAVVSPQSSSSQPSDMPSSPVFFRKKKQARKSISALPCDVDQVSLPLNQMPDQVSEAALNQEDYNLWHFNFDSWLDDWYQLRFEEAILIAEIVTQLGQTLNLGLFCLADQGDSLSFMLQKIESIEGKSREDIQAHLDPEILLAQILKAAPSQNDLQNVLVLHIRHAHWMLISFDIQAQTITSIDSLPASHAHHLKATDLKDYAQLVDILSNSRNENAIHWNHQYISTGHQPMSSDQLTVGNLSCGFWASAYAFLLAMGTPLQSRMSLFEVKNMLKTMVLEYKTGQSGVLTQETLVTWLASMVPNIRARFISHAHLKIWAPMVAEGQRDSRFMLVQESPRPISESNAAMSNIEPEQSTTLSPNWRPRAVTQAEQLKLNKMLSSSKHQNLAYKCKKHSLDNHHWLSLQKSQWITSGVLDFVSACMNNPTLGLWFHSTSFMPLLKESYSKVSRLRPFGQVNKEPVSVLNDIKKIFIPFNEPIVSMKKMPSAAQSYPKPTGSHWAAIIINPPRKSVTYKSSLLNQTAAQEAIKLTKGYLKNLGLHRKADKGKYLESAWTFGIEECHQQANSYDCGLYVVVYMLECHLNMTLGWTDTHIKVLRQQLAIQIVEGNLDIGHLLENTNSGQEGDMTHSYYVAITPTCKRHQSKTPSASPEVILHRKKSHTPLASQRQVKRLKMAPFSKGTFAAVTAGTHSEGKLDVLESKKLHEHVSHLLTWSPAPDPTPVDDDSLCPFCDVSLPESLRQESTAQLKPLLSLSRLYPRLDNSAGREPLPGHNIAISEFCYWHQQAIRTAQIESAGFNWPEVIDQSKLPSRVLNLLPEVAVLISEPSSGFALNLVYPLWRDFGRKYCISPLGLCETRRKVGFAYYGDAGASIIFQELLSASQKRIIQLHLGDWNGITDRPFIIQNILTPEVILRLVMEDMDIGAEEARAVMEQSKEYGLMGNTRLM